MLKERKPMVVSGGLLAAVLIALMLLNDTGTTSSATVSVPSTDALVAAPTAPKLTTICSLPAASCSVCTNPLFWTPPSPTTRPAAKVRAARPAMAPEPPADQPIIRTRGTAPMDDEPAERPQVIVKENCPEQPGTWLFELRCELRHYTFHPDGAFQEGMQFGPGLTQRLMSLEEARRVRKAVDAAQSRHRFRQWQWGDTPRPAEVPRPGIDY